MSQAIIKEVEKQYIKQDVPEFRVGDTVDVATRIVEGEKERTRRSEPRAHARRVRFPCGHLDSEALLSGPLRERKHLWGLEGPPGRKPSVVSGRAHGGDSNRRP